MTVSAMHPSQNFEKHSWKHWLSVKFTLAAVVFIGYGFLWEIFINDIAHGNIHREMFYTSTLNSMRQFDDDLLFYKNKYF